MGEHSAPRDGRLTRAARWVRTNRRSLALAALVALPIVSRYVPDFPADEALALLRGFLGAP